MSDANNESHDYGIGNKELGDNPEWTKAHVDRALSMTLRDRNHPCIVFWSLGNEAGRGLNSRAMADTVRALDPTRILFYDSDRSVSDIYDDSYLSVERFEQLAERITHQPVIMREYAFAMGNSLGNLIDYQELFESREDIAGAAIWEWFDHGIAKKIDGSPLHYPSNPAQLELQPDEFFAYGGDFGDHPNDGAFIINGLVGANRIPNPHFYEVPKVFQYIDFSLENINTIRLKNKYWFTGLDEFDYYYELLNNGNISKTGWLQANGTILNIPAYTLNDTSEILLNVYSKLKKETIWAPAGFSVAKEQFLIKNKQFLQIKTVAQDIKMKQNDSEIEITAGSNVFTINKTTGSLTSWKNEGKELLYGELTPHFWKPANEIQRNNQYERRLSAWRNAARERTVKNVKSNINNGLAFVEIEMYLPAIGAEYSLKYTVNSSGNIQVEAFYQLEKENIPLIPKFGMKMLLPASMNQIEWYGRGEFENYPDRKTAAFIGLYKMDLKRFITNYTVPQDNANRSDVRWFSISENKKSSIKVTGLQTLCFRVWPYDEKDLETAKHPFEIPQRDFVTVNIDLNIHGVGGNDGWGAPTMDKYTINGNQPYHYGFILEYNNDNKK